jgi:hypothetical protein
METIMGKPQSASQKATTAAPAPAASTELAERQTTAVAEASTAMFAADAGQGMEGATAESFAIPFLSVLQSNSPQVDEASGQAIEGARAGMFFENVTGRLVSGKPDGGGVRFVPCAYRRVFLRWGPRSGEGAGFKGELLPEEVAALRARGEIVEVDGRLYFPDADGSIKRAKDGSVQNDRLSDTRNHYVLLLNDEDGSWQQALLSLTSTQIKKSKTLMAALASVKMQGPSGMFTPPTFANVVRATTLPESNDKGNWFGIRMEIVARVDRAEVYAAAKAFRDSVVKGQIEVKYEEPAPGGEGGSGEGF